MQFLIPIGLFVKNIGRFELGFLYLLLIFFIFSYSNYERQVLKNTLTFSKKSYYSFFVIICLQSIAMIVTHFHVDMSFDSYKVSAVRNLIRFYLFVLELLMYYAIMTFFLYDKRQVLKILRGYWYGLILTLSLAYLQLFNIIQSDTILKKVVLTLATLFEKRDKSQPSWYLLGSYSETLRRVNGFYAEASFLAGLIAIIFTPFILSAIKNKYDLFYKRKGHTFKYYLALMLIIMMLILIGSTTGLLAIAIIAAVFFISLPRKQKYYWTVVFIVLSSFIFFLYQTNEYINTTVGYYLFGKSGSNSNLNRTGGTLALIKTFLDNSLLGVGRGNESYFSFINVPDKFRFNSEYNQFLTIHKGYPIMSIFFGWLAAFGIITSGIVLSYFYKVFKDLGRIPDIVSEDRDFHKTISDGFRYFLIFYLSLSIVGFPWNSYVYFITIFFMIAYRNSIGRKNSEDEKTINWD